MFEETLVYKRSSGLKRVNIHRLNGYPTKDNRFLISDSLEEIIDYFDGRNISLEFNLADGKILNRIKYNINVSIRQ